MSVMLGCQEATVGESRGRTVDADMGQWLGAPSRCLRGREAGMSLESDARQPDFLQYDPSNEEPPGCQSWSEDFQALSGLFLNR